MILVIELLQVEGGVHYKAWRSTMAARLSTLAPKSRQDGRYGATQSFANMQS